MLAWINSYVYISRLTKMKPTELFLLTLMTSMASASLKTRLRQSLSNDGHHHNGLFAVDLTHTLSDVAPVTEGASPLEMIRENMDDGHGGR